jgi:hypothetical protein
VVDVPRGRTASDRLDELEIKVKDLERGISINEGRITNAEYELNNIKPKVNDLEDLKRFHTKTWRYSASPDLDYTPLANGQFGFDEKGNVLKIGDGHTPWSMLPVLAKEVTDPTGAPSSRGTEYMPSVPADDPRGYTESLIIRLTTNSEYFAILGFVADTVWIWDDDLSERILPRISMMAWLNSNIRKDDFPYTDLAVLKT